MVTQAEAKIHRVGPRHTIYLAKDLVEDSTFPFRGDENLTVRIEGDALIVDRDGKTGRRAGRMDSLRSDREKLLMKSLDLLRFSPLVSKAERINQMLSEIHEAEVLESRIRHIPRHEHGIFLWEEEAFVDMVLSEFFDTGAAGKVSKGLLSTKPSSFENVNNLVSKDLLGLEKHATVAKIRKWMSEIQSANETDLPARIAIEDYTLFLQNGLAKELVGLEQDIGPRTKQNVTVLCGYNTSRITDPRQLEKLLSFHSCVILDQPIRVFKRGGFEKLL